MTADAHGTDKGTRERSWLGWALTLLAVVMIYLLTAPALFFYSMSGWGKGDIGMPPPRVMAYVKPYDRLSEVPLLAGEMSRYSEWWERRIFSREMMLEYGR